MLPRLIGLALVLLAGSMVYGQGARAQFMVACQTPTFWCGHPIGDPIPFQACQCTTGNGPVSGHTVVPGGPVPTQGPRIDPDGPPLSSRETIEGATGGVVGCLVLLGNCEALGR